MSTHVVLSESPEWQELLREAMDFEPNFDLRSPKRFRSRLNDRALIYPSDWILLNDDELQAIRTSAQPSDTVALFLWLSSSKTARHTGWVIDLANNDGYREVASEPNESLLIATSGNWAIFSDFDDLRLIAGTDEFASRFMASLGLDGLAQAEELLREQFINHRDFGLGIGDVPDIVEHIYGLAGAGLVARVRREELGNQAPPQLR